MFEGPLGQQDQNGGFPPGQLQQSCWKARASTGSVAQAQGSAGLKASWRLDVGDCLPCPSPVKGAWCRECHSSHLPGGGCWAPSTCHVLQVHHAGPVLGCVTKSQQHSAHRSDNRFPQLLGQVVAAAWVHCRQEAERTRLGGGGSPLCSAEHLPGIRRFPPPPASAPSNRSHFQVPSKKGHVALAPRWVCLESR